MIRYSVINISTNLHRREGAEYKKWNIKSVYHWLNVPGSSLDSNHLITMGTFMVII